MLLAVLLQSHSSLGADKPHLGVLASCTEMVPCACSWHWVEDKFRPSCFCRCCLNVDHLLGFQCMLENCQLCCDNIIACTAAEPFVLLEQILSFCNKSALSSTRRPKNLASAAFKGTKVAISLYLGKKLVCDLTAVKNIQQMESMVKHVG